MAETGSKTIIDKVGRVAVPVSDQDRAIEFYTEKLGFTLDADITVDNNYRWVEVSPPGAAPRSPSFLRRRAPPTGSGSTPTSSSRQTTSTRPTPSCRHAAWTPTTSPAWAIPSRRCSSSATRTRTPSSSWRTRSSGEQGHLARDDVARRLHHRPGRRHGVGVRVPREPGQAGRRGEALHRRDPRRPALVRRGDRALQRPPGHLRRRVGGTGVRPDPPAPRTTT